MNADLPRRCNSGAAWRLRRATMSRARAHPALERLLALMLALALAAIAPARLHAQSAQSYDAPADADTQSAEFLPQDQLDALLAPIALYPDDLLAQVLMASTYPLEVVEAARFVQQNPGLAGPALDDALRAKPWDPSVASLAAFPQVLAMMNDQIEWTQQIGDAFLANRQQVMDTVQGLRARAQAAGTLQGSDKQRVYGEDGSIVIEPAQPDYVYVPVYDPMIAYGPWWVASYQPLFWYPPAFYGYPVYQISTVIIFGRPHRVNRNHWGWAHPQWRAGSINVTVGRNDFFNRQRSRNLYRGSDVSWRHAPEHRRGVAYGSAAVSRQYANVERRPVDVRRELRPGDAARGPNRQAPPRAVVATPQGAPTYRQPPADARAAAALRAPRSVAAPGGQPMPQYRAAPPPSLPRPVVPASQSVPAPQAAAREAPALVREAPAERGRVVRQGPGPEGGDAGQRAR